MSSLAKPKAGDKSDYQCFNLTIENDIAHIQLNRPEKYNSMIPAFWSELPQLIHHIDDEAKARVIVLSAQGKHFCAGMDLAVFGQNNDDNQLSATRSIDRRAAMLSHVADLQHTFSCLDECRMPVLMAVQGGCIGGAVDFASACDMRYCTKDAFFCIQEINIGMTADVGTFPRLPHLIPQGLVRELAYTGRRLEALEAHDCGLVNKVFDTQEDMLVYVMETAKTIAEKAPYAVWGSKEMINYARDHSIQDGLKHIALWQTGMFNPPDMQESFVAQQQKRTPQFSNLPKKQKPL